MKPLVITGLNSCLALSAVELWPTKVWPERANYAFSEKLGIRPKTGFLAHNCNHVTSATTSHLKPIYVKQNNILHNMTFSNYDAQVSPIYKILKIF